MTQYFTLDEIDHGVAGNTADAQVPRRQRRRSVLWPMEIVSKPLIRCMIVDISMTGAKVRVSKPLVTGETLVVRSRCFFARARVAWAKDDLVGLEFVEPGEQLLRTLDAP